MFDEYKIKYGSPYDNMGAFTKYVRFWGGGQRFVTNLCKNIGICTVLRYEGGGGSKIPEYSVTYFVNGPYMILWEAIG
jgi:hypothetical protein